MCHLLLFVGIMVAIFLHLLSTCIRFNPNTCGMALCQGKTEELDMDMCNFNTFLHAFIGNKKLNEIAINTLGKRIEKGETHWETLLNTLNDPGDIKRRKIIEKILYYPVTVFGESLTHKLKQMKDTKKEIYKAIYNPPVLNIVEIIPYLFHTKEMREDDDVICNGYLGNEYNIATIIDFDVAACYYPPTIIKLFYSLISLDFEVMFISLRINCINYAHITAIVKVAGDYIYFDDSIEPKGRNHRGNRGDVLMFKLRSILKLAYTNPHYRAEVLISTISKKNINTIFEYDTSIKVQEYLTVDALNSEGYFNETIDRYYDPLEWTISWMTELTADFL